MWRYLKGKNSGLCIGLRKVTRICKGKGRIKKATGNVNQKYSQGYVGYSRDCPTEES